MSAARRLSRFRQVCDAPFATTPSRVGSFGRSRPDIMGQDRKWSISAGSSKPKQPPPLRPPSLLERYSYTVSVVRAALTLAVYCVVSIVVLCAHEPWSVADSLYFSMATVTTVGYGDWYPETMFGRVFIALLILQIIVYKLPVYISRITELTSRNSPYSVGRMMYKSTNDVPHIVICG